MATFVVCLLCDVGLWELDVRQMFPRLSGGDPGFEPILGPVVGCEAPRNPGIWEAIATKLAPK